MQESDNIRLIFAADIVPTETNEQYFIEGDTEHLFGDELLKYMKGADFRCFNLEVPLTYKHKKVYYPGPHLIAKPETINAIKRIDPSLITIGNNHALDQGEEGCHDTMSVLKNADIKYTGAGDTLTEARKPFYVDLKGIRVGIFNCTEYEFAAATKETCGANPFDPLDSFDQVEEMSKECDISIVLYHGGKEFYRYPSPRLQKACRKFVDSGADLVICQHTHCIGCEEKYRDSTIVYGQGNFLFDRNENEYKLTGMFVETVVDTDTCICKVFYKPFVKENECIRLAEKDRFEEIMSDFRKRSLEILIPGFLERSYSEFADVNFEKYVEKIMGRNFALKVINRLCGRRFYSNFFEHDNEAALAALNIISPENHRELFMQGLRNAAHRTNRNT